LIEAIKQIGDYYIRKTGRGEAVDIAIQDPASNPNYKHVLAIVLREIESGFEFSGVRHDEYSTERIMEYLYRTGSANGPDVTPTSRITEIEKTFNKKTLAWFKNTLKDTRGLEKGEIEFLEGIRACLEQNKDWILAELKEKIQGFGKNENGIITLIITDRDGERYVGDFPVFRKLLVASATSGYYRKYNTESRAEDKVCSVCRSLVGEVYGFVSTYTFYTADKPGFVSGGFDQKFAWRNYPVCLNCALALEEGKKYLENFLKYRFYGFNYYVIPKFIMPEKSGEVYQLLEDFRGETRDGKIEFKREFGSLLSDAEDEVLEFLAGQENFMNNNFLFYEETNSAFRILLYIEDIPPSRLRTLFEAKRAVDRKSVFREFGGDGLVFNFGCVWHFFKSREQDLTRYFLEITNRVFTDKKVDYHFLLWAIMNRIKREFAHREQTKLSALWGLQLLDYLNTLNLLDNFNGGGKLEEIKDPEKIMFGPMEERAEKLFSEFPDFFNQPAKRAVFLEGVLAQKLLNIQYQQGRETPPFRTKLQGLKLDERLVKRLLPEMQNKLEEYNKNYYRELEAVISKYMVQSGENWKLSRDEISFYFVLGMNLHHLFKREENNGETEERGT